MRIIETTRLEELEKESRKLETSGQRRQNWNQLIQAHADHFLDQLPDSNAFDLKADRGKGLLDCRIEEEGKPMEQLLATLSEHVDENGINPASGKHLGYIPGGGVFPAALGDYLAAVTNRYAGMFFANPGAVRIENQLIRWVSDMVGFPETSHGNLTSGGSIANLAAIICARDSRNVQLEDIRKQVIYVTSQTHHCVQKAYRIAGMGEAPIRYIPTDERFRMDTSLLHQTIENDTRAGLQPFMIIGSAGTTDTGAIDPLDELADIAQAYNCWFHVDAAYGGFFMLSPEQRPKFKGISRANSVVIDPHKGLFIPYGSGVVLIRDAKILYDTFNYTASYLQDALDATEELNPSDLSPELTKHFRGMRMWLPLQLFGVRPFRACAEEKIALCHYFYNRIQEVGFQVGPEPDLSVMIYRFMPEGQDPNIFNEALVNYIQKDGRVFLSSTQIDGIYWIRLAVLSFRTHRREIDIVIETLKEGVDYLLKKQKKKSSVV